MVGRLVILIAGVATGILMMLVLERPARSPDEAMATSSTPLQTSEFPEPNGVTQPVANEVADVRQVDFKSAVSAEESTDDPIKMPSVYRELIGPFSPPTLSFPELHALFEKEPRDEAWAYAMETGINDHLATYGAGEGVVVEYVECRSRYCEVGGFAIEGYEADFSIVWGGMFRSDWWQGGSQLRSVGGGSDGLRRFLAIIHRYDRQRPRQ